MRPIRFSTFFFLSMFSFIALSQEIVPDEVFFLKSNTAIKADGIAEAEWNNPMLFASVLLWDDADSWEKAAPPTFSHLHGFYNSPFNLTIQGQSQGDTLLITLDGSNPVSSTNRIIGKSPYTIRIDPSSSKKRGKTPAFMVTASIQKHGYKPSETFTQTYIFLDAVKKQTHPGGDWPTDNINGQHLDYEMGQEVVEHRDYKSLMDEALLDIPSISLVADIDDLFGSKNGIYVNAERDGAEWERPVSMELIYPKGEVGFQINAGLRIRGGWSRHPDNPKHAFRLFFRNEYGYPKLEYPLFGEEGVNQFDKVDLRTSQNYAWSYKSDMGRHNTMNRDVFSRDAQREMGQPYTRSRYYHLYLNGMYWGLFQTQERSEASYAEQYFGGEREDYDVVKPGREPNWGSLLVEATDGNLDAWNDIWDRTNKGFSSNKNYFALQGKNEKGKRNYSLTNYVDVENLIDYMITIFYTGNFDAPTSKFGRNKSPNNFYAIYHRSGLDGFKFFAHDCEHSLLAEPANVGSGIEENRVNIGSEGDRYLMVVEDLEHFHPQWLHHKLTNNEEYRQFFADRVYKHFFNQGVFTETKAQDLFWQRAMEIENAIIAESARWGDSRNWTSRTRNDDWVPAVDAVMNDFIPYRATIVLDQLQDEGLYSYLNPPIFKDQAKKINSPIYDIQNAATITLENPNSKGLIYYTRDGSDPRMTGGALSAGAQEGGKQKKLNIGSSTIIKARIKEGTRWSPLHELAFLKKDDLSMLKITEINYNPEINDEHGITGAEFVEFKNTGKTNLNLSGVKILGGIDFVFPRGTVLKPREFVVISNNRMNFMLTYGSAPDGNFEKKLSNGGDEIHVLTADNKTLMRIYFNDDSPWPPQADGGGYTLVPTVTNPMGDPSKPDYWTYSIKKGGSPGYDEGANSIDEILISKGLVTKIERYPNPVKETLHYHISNPAKEGTLRLFDLYGRKVFDEHITTQSNTELSGTIDINRLCCPSGQYILSYTAKGVHITEKVLLW